LEWSLFPIAPNLAGAFSRTALASEPQAYFFAKKAIAKVEVGKGN